MYDLLLKGGNVLDPAQGLNGVQDIAVEARKIVRIAPSIGASEAKRVIELRGKLVTPGLIDLHTHTYWGAATEGVNEMSVPPDLAGVLSGVTTVVDAGTAGALTLGALARFVAPAARTRLFSFLHINRTGQFAAPDSAGRDTIDLDVTIKAILLNKPLVQGVKARMVSPGIELLGLELAKLAIKAARESGVRFMVHIGDTAEPPSPKAPSVTRQMVERMAPGDIITHICTANPGGLVDSNGKAMPELLEARRRGVTLDCAHGRRNFSFDTAENLIAQGILPDTISTDLTQGGRLQMVYSQTECMSKFLALGLPLEQVVRMSTTNPARALGMADSLGAIAVGREADISVLDIVEGDWQFTDSFRQTRRGKLALAPVLTIRAGEPISPDWGPHPWGWLPALGGPDSQRA